MPEAISNTSPLLYLYRIGVVEWLPKLFSKLWLPNAVVLELQEGHRRGYDVPTPRDYVWIQIVEPNAIPSEWLTLDLGAGELAAMALALENPSQVVLLDDALARRIAHAARSILIFVLALLINIMSNRCFKHFALRSTSTCRNKRRSKNLAACGGIFNGINKTFL